MCIRKVNDGDTITIHSDSTRTIPGSRYYIHAADVADAMHFLLGLDHTTLLEDYGGAKCPKFNLVGPEEINNLELAQIIAKSQGKELKYEMQDFHSSRPGHDLRYALSGDYSNAYYVVSTLDINSINAASVITNTSPTNATANSDYSYTEKINEFPKTL